VTERVYLDAFAGSGEGMDRLTGETFEGSVRIALGIDDPAFTKLRFFEVPTKAERLRRQLAKEFPDRDLRVYGGDCNRTIPEALHDLRDMRWAPTFAFLDPDGMELAWETLTTHLRITNEGIGGAPPSPSTKSRCGSSFQVKV
jgi:three-Cys-motif partner protein